MGMLGAIALVVLCFSLAAQGAPVQVLMPSADQVASASGFAEPSFQPVRDHSLAEALSRYRSLAPGERWSSLADGPYLTLGMIDPQLSEIRRRLSILGDHNAWQPWHVNSEYYDRPLYDAVRRFQSRHGLKVDGIIGPNTRAELSVAPDQRADQIALNIYRQADFPAEPPAEYLQINIPAYQLSYVRDRQLELQMRAIVGQPDRPTPQLRSKLQSVVLNPAWNVPKGIAYRDIIPYLRRNPERVLNRLGLKLVQGYDKPPQLLDPSQLDFQRLYLGRWSQQQRFWQPPGRKNALGNIKFTFPNRYTVYIHGTPQHSLFREPFRTFSSGCIRIEHPRRLAERLMDNESDDTVDLDVLLAGEQTLELPLPREVPLFLTYWTAWVEPDGILQFRRDVYHWDDYPLVDQR
ncbi:L,D-transpeptidase family protein [Marinobacterium arenosum]|uniref:L,D-transpeptidase family protein n=1 Tax=Marinobacterium arenosum TaxID=2862496 RepID=UPI001C972D94|nr:L,D-transpeptidase family protein [Marinobacterium arenosum]MBY4677798.1 L,D-transpeptidase family protein [Marinobacterium arenosum]